MNNPSHLEAVFFAALNLRSPQERTAYLDEACAGDAELRQRVEKMLEAEAEAKSFLEQPADRPTATAAMQPMHEGPGATIGAYTLLEEIGEGGFGVVFLAEQTAPVRRKVALKILKPGMDTRQVTVRFEAERQALAIMDHPNIARVFDGGATPSGRPYFVMELVKGVPITEYCDQNQLEPRLRLELFVTVCQAVQHAHQKGIIHRDLKPSNVLVSRHDTTPIVKVIDFGVAKALGPALTDKTLFTSVAQMIGTPLYMSPEQAGTSDVDTRSDIYSLGVLLYELLTGTTPFSKERFKTAANDEIRRIIREEEPPTPSTRLSSSTDLLPSISAHRHMEPAKLTRLVRGELDWIVMKSLEKDRARRYETANGFAADVLRYLADEPVQACPPSAGYRLRKFARRNKGPVLAASLVLLTLVVGILGTTLGMLRARTAEANASREAGEKTEALTEAKINLEDAMAAVDQLLTRLGDERLAEVPQVEPIRRELLQDALKFYQKFLARKSDDPVIRREAARCYWRMGKIYFQLGQERDANEAFQKAIEMMEEQGAASSRDPQHRLELVQTLVDYSWVVQTKADQFVRLRRRAVEVAESLVADFGELPESLAKWHLARTALGYALKYVQPDEAESILQETLRLADDHESLRMAHENLGFLYWAKERWPEAAEQFRHTLKQREKCLTKTPEALGLRRDLGFTLFHLAYALTANQQLAEAEEYERQAIVVLDQLAREFPSGPQHRDYLAKALMGHAFLLKQLGQSAEAEKAYRRAADVYEKLTIDFTGKLDHRQDLVRSHLELARLLKSVGRIDESQTSFDQAVAIQEALEKDFAGKPEFRLELARAHMSTALQLNEDGRADEADRFYLLAEAHCQKLIAGASDDFEGLRGLAETYHALGMLLEALSRKRDAENAFTHGIKTCEKLLALAPKEVGVRALKGHLHRHVAFLDEANPARLMETEKHFREAMRLFDALDSDFPDAGYWRFFADTHRRLGFILKAPRPQEAEDTFRRLVDLHEQRAAKHPSNPQFNSDMALAYSNLGDQLAANGRAQDAKKIHQAADALLKKNSQGIKREPEKKQN